MSNIGNFRYTAGLNNVGSYQVSGMPWVTGSVNCLAGTGEQVVKFPYVTKWVTINNNSGQDLRVAFSQNGVLGKQYFVIPAFDVDSGGNTRTLNLKLTEIWISGSLKVDVVAGLTNLPVSRIDNNTVSPSGSNWSGSYDGIGYDNGYGIG